MVATMIENWNAFIPIHNLQPSRHRCTRSRSLSRMWECSHRSKQLVIRERLIIAGVNVILLSTICRASSIGPFVFGIPGDTGIIPTKIWILEPRTAIHTTCPIRKPIGTRIEGFQARAAAWKTPDINIELVRQPHTEIPMSTSRDASIFRVRKEKNEEAL
jgi:hypothetical protein